MRPPAQRQGGQHRRIDRKQVAASLRQLEALFGDLKREKLRIQNEIAGRQPGEIGKAENSNNTLPQPATNWQGGRK